MCPSSTISRSASSTAFAARSTGLAGAVADALAAGGAAVAAVGAALLSPAPAASTEPLHPVDSTPNKSASKPSPPRIVARSLARSLMEHDPVELQPGSYRLESRLAAPHRAS